MCAPVCGALSAPLRRWFQLNGQVPVVRLTNGSEVSVLPVAFTSNVPGYGACVRVQVRACVHVRQPPARLCATPVDNA